METVEGKLALKNLGSAILGQAVAILAGLLVPRLYLLAYGSEVNGLLSSVQQCLSCLALLEAGVGMAAVQSLYGPAGSGDREGVNGILSAAASCYRWAGGLYLGALVLLSAAYPLLLESGVERKQAALAVLLGGVGHGSSLFLLGKYRLLLQAEGKNHVITLAGTVLTAVTAMGKLILIRLGAGLTMVLVLPVLLQAGQVLWFCLYFRRRYPWVTWRAAPNREAVARKNHALLHQIAGMVFQNTDVLLLTVVRGLREVSVYSVYKLAFSQLENLMAMCSNSVGFALGQAWQRDRKEFARKLDGFEDSHRVLSFTLLSVAGNLILPFVRLYTRGVADAEYGDDRAALLFTLTAVLAAARQPGLLAIQYAGHFRETLPQTLAETAINLAVSLVCVKKWGICGVLLGTAAALGYRTWEVWCYENTVLLGRSPAKTAGRYLQSGLILAAMQVSFWLLPIKIESWGSFLLAGCGDLLVTAAVFLAAEGLRLGKRRKQRIIGGGT